MYSSAALAVGQELMVLSWSVLLGIRFVEVGMGKNVECPQGLVLTSFISRTEQVMWRQVFGQVFANTQASGGGECLLRNRFPNVGGTLRLL
jgi:hypothetical protein